MSFILGTEYSNKARSNQLTQLTGHRAIHDMIESGNGVDNIQIMVNDEDDFDVRLPKNWFHATEAKGKNSKIIVDNGRSTFCHQRSTRPSSNQIWSGLVWFG